MARITTIVTLDGIFDLDDLCALPALSEYSSDEVLMLLDWIVEEGGAVRLGRDQWRFKGLRLEITNRNEKSRNCNR